MAKKILIIDDEPNVLDFLEQCVTNLGHEPVKAATCKEAYAALDADPSISIVIADIFLPDSPGPDQWIKGISDKAEKRPLIIITGMPSAEIKKSAEAYGVEHFLTKPFELPFLDELLKKLSSGSD